MNQKLGFAMMLPVGMVLLLGLTGCPRPRQAQVTVLMSADLESGGKSVVEKLGAVGVEEIESLIVTLTQISLDRSGDVEPEGEEEPPSKVVVYSGAVDIELRDLVGVSELISTAEIPAGVYTKIRLSIENPRMRLVSDPEVVITDIQTTANGRLFVSSSFTVPAGQRSLILLDFQGLHLVETGSGKYVWTPQLRAEISVEPADVLVQGVVDSVDMETETLLLLPDTDTELLLIHYGDAVIFLPDDTDVPTGTEADLEPGAQLIVEGLLTISGEVIAEIVWILPDE